MNALAQTVQPVIPGFQAATNITSTLYDLIEAISEEVPSGEEGLIVEAVLNLMRSDQIKWVSRHRNSKPI